MTHVNGFKQFKIAKLKFEDGSDKNRATWCHCDSLSRIRISEIDHAKRYTQIITFEGIFFFGQFHWEFPQIFRNLKVLNLLNIKVFTDSKFRAYRELKVLKVSGTQSMKNDYRQCTHAFNGLSMITLSSMLYGQLTFKLSDKASSIEHLEADVNFRHSFDNCYQNFKYFLKQMQLRMVSIGTITICKLTDYESVLSFEIIYLLLLSVAQLEYTHKFPPIELRVAKFSYRSDKYDPEFSKIKLSDTLSAYMGEMKLDITSIEENMDRKKVTIRMRLSNQIAREMKLIVDRSKEGSIFEIANAESQDNSAKAINIQRKFQIQRQEIS